MIMLKSVFVVIVLSTLSAQVADAQQFVYQPKNPAFGGIYLNYQWLLSSAEAQKDFEQEDSRFSSLYDDPLGNFQDNLQRQILSQLSREIVTSRFGDELDLTREGVYDLGEFTIEIVPGLQGVDIRIFNAMTGDESTVTIPSF